MPDRIWLVNSLRFGQTHFKSKRTKLRDSRRDYTFY